MIGAGEGDQNVGGSPKLHSDRNLIRKWNRMVQNMGISKKFKSIEYTTNDIDPGSEKSVFIASLGVELLAWEAGFRHKSLEFIVRSILIHNA